MLEKNVEFAVISHDDVLVLTFKQEMNEIKVCVVSLVVIKYPGFFKEEGLQLLGSGFSCRSIVKE